MRKKTKVQISLYASSLKNIAGFGKGTSDPYAVITLLAGSADVRPRILGRTEVVKNNLSPSWTHTFITDYSFGEETRVNVGIFDEVRKGHNKSMGSAQFEVGEVLGAKGNIRAKALKNGGTLFMRVHKASDLDLGTLNLSMRGMKLKNVDGLFGKSDPFFTVEAYTQGNQQYEGRSWLPVYKSETVKNNLNPVWKECQIPIEKLCNGNKELPIQISVYDWEKVRKFGYQH
jgi:Ca2+-dependent lipid-binding protein